VVKKLPQSHKKNLWENVYIVERLFMKIWANVLAVRFHYMVDPSQTDVGIGFLIKLQDCVMVVSMIGQHNKILFDR
jgi:hypothetical protein